jgi:hypothetical protein
MNQIAIHSKLTLFNLNVGYNIIGTHSNFGNVLKRKSDLNMLLSFHCTYRISQYWWKKKSKISWTQEGIIVSRHHREKKNQNACT